MSYNRISEFQRIGFANGKRIDPESGNWTYEQCESDLSQTYHANKEWPSEDLHVENEGRLNMYLRVKHFYELTGDELYAILRLRVSVFVVEQNCPYQEADNLDQDAIHVWLEDEDGIEAYLRILDRGVENENVAIGRVIAAKRGCGLGSQIMEEGIRAAKVLFNADKIYVEAQTYAREFYEKQGFRQISDEFLLDGIPHVGMILE